MRIIFLIIYLADLLIGLLFGSIGHVLSILVFPLIAVLHGYFLVREKQNARDIYISLILAAFLLMVGLGIGLVMASNRFINSDQIEIVSNSIINKAINMGYFTTVIYALVYVLIGYLSYYLTKNNRVTKTDIGV